MMAKSAVILAGIAVFSLAACSGAGKSSKGPDEFAVVPTKPLTMPDDLNALPEPRPGALSRVDQEPNKDAVAALGGNGAALDGNLIRSSEQTLLRSAQRYGVDPSIRSTLATEDLKQRKDNPPRVLERLAGYSSTIRAYTKFELDADRELIRLRRLGVRTPTAPPAE
ncbi:hypothetical protein GCM10008927_26910 [Amylibacter ulvae]|uniref:DUF3035 domain-containing protein n=2 Tax=Paramylibacter ulvae TaxID=1651968 RepID=A0ABQ3D5J2_9RHOB|nr:hypothetical protein GCM10008927_26910 [Amylibacter ulvae]